MKLHKNTTKRIIIFILALSLTLPAFVLMSFDDDDDFELLKNLEIYHTVLKELRILYVDEISPGELIKISIDKMLETLDPYTVYYPESLVEDYRFITTGEYGGIGADVQFKDGKFVFIDIYENSPASKAGIVSGDIIQLLDGKSLINKTLEDLGMILKGEAGSRLQVSVLRPFLNRTLELTVTRENIVINDVTYSTLINNSIGYIRLEGFTEKASGQFLSAFLALKKSNTLKGLVIDLRGNPGGLLVEAVSIVNNFVPKGTNVVSMKGQVEQWNKTFNAINEPTDLSIPIVVLVDSNSASAAEIVAGALQDLDRAVILGHKTYGKGLVQTTRDLLYNAKLKVTTAKYYIPSGRCIQKIDYAHKDKYGKAVTYSDSIVRTFKTKHGRMVYDAGGIIPDVTIHKITDNQLVGALLQSNLIFDYSIKYYYSKNKPASVSDISITDSDYTDFKNFVIGSGFIYKSQAEVKLDSLIAALAKENILNENIDLIAVMQ